MTLESSVSASTSGKDIYELSLNGRIYRPHWVVHLFSALSLRHISIVSGFATQQKPGVWTSKFTLDFSNSSADPMTLNYASFADQASVEDVFTEPRLTRFETSRRADDLLVVRLEGPDQIGFLASILANIALLALFPAALEITTFNGSIHDTIVLRRMGIGEHGPSEATCLSLENMLSSFLLRGQGTRLARRLPAA